MAHITEMWSGLTAPRGWTVNLLDYEKVWQALSQATSGLIPSVALMPPVRLSVFMRSAPRSSEVETHLQSDLHLAEPEYINQCTLISGRLLMLFSFWRQFQKVPIWPVHCWKGRINNKMQHKYLEINYDYQVLHSFHSLMGTNQSSRRRNLEFLDKKSPAFNNLHMDHVTRLSMLWGTCADHHFDSLRAPTWQQSSHALIN